MASLKQTPASPRNGKKNPESCEIVVVIASIPIYVGNLLLHQNCISFQAESRSASNATVVAPAKGSDDLSQVELNAGCIKDTPKRQVMIEELTKALISDHWQLAGQGKDWFNRKFLREVA